MTVFAVLLSSVLFLFLLVRFFKYLAALYVLLASLCLLGVPVALFDLDLGITMVLWSALGCAVLFFGTVIAAFVTAVFAVPVGGVVTAFKIASFKMESPKKVKRALNS